MRKWCDWNVRVTRVINGEVADCAAHLSITTKSGVSDPPLPCAATSITCCDFDIDLRLPLASPPLSLLPSLRDDAVPATVQGCTLSQI